MTTIMCFLCGSESDIDADVNSNESLNIIISDSIANSTESLSKSEDQEVSNPSSQDEENSELRSDANESKSTSAMSTSTSAWNSQKKRGSCSNRKSKLGRQLRKNKIMKIKNSYASKELHKLSKKRRIEHMRIC